MMGMGEPLYNFEAVRDALLIVADGDGIGISKRRITLSTSGVVPMIERAGAEIGCMLAVSLHAVRDELRNELVPLNRKYPIAQLMEACRNYPGVSNAKRITFEYVMLKGVNDFIEDAKALVRLLKGIPAKINLIPFNPWPGSNTNAPTGSRSRSSRRWCSTPAMPRRCARRAGATSSPPAASSRARAKNSPRASAWRCAPWRWWSDCFVRPSHRHRFALIVASLAAGAAIAFGAIGPGWHADFGPVRRRHRLHHRGVLRVQLHRRGRPVAGGDPDRACRSFQNPLAARPSRGRRGAAGGGLLRQRPGAAVLRRVRSTIRHRRFRARPRSSPPAARCSASPIGRSPAATPAAGASGGSRRRKHLSHRSSPRKRGPSSYALVRLRVLDSRLRGNERRMFHRLRPLQRRVQPVVAPEQFAVGGDEARRAEDAEPRGFLRLRAQARLDRVALRLAAITACASWPSRVSTPAIVSGSPISRPSPNSRA